MKNKILLLIFISFSTMLFSQEKSIVSDLDELKLDPMVRIDLSRIPNVSSLRVIDIDSIDVCPCAGTHVESTGVIPRIKLDGVKSKGAGKLRVTYRFE